MNKIGYMCKKSFEQELGQPSEIGRVYSSPKALQAACQCVAQCGIVEVRVELVEVVQETYDDEEEIK